MKSLLEELGLAINRSLSGEKDRVLIVEDYVDLANVIEILLRRCGFEVKSVNDGRLVLSMAQSFRPHYVILDIKLPGMDGHRIAEMIREDKTLEKTIIVGISAYRPDQRPDSSVLRLFDHYLMKPFELESLLQALSRPFR